MSSCCLVFGCTERVEETLKDEKKGALTTPDATSTVPTMVRGDWVLFHPVYSPEELKAVEVTSSPYPPRYLTNMMHPLFPRSSTANPRHSRIPLLVGSSNLHERCLTLSRATSTSPFQPIGSLGRSRSCGRKGMSSTIRHGSA